MTDLKPCPFCGEEDYLFPTYRMGSIGPDLPINIQCLGCGIELAPGSGQSAITAWNRRASLTPVSASDQKGGGGRHPFPDYLPDFCEACGKSILKVDAQWTADGSVFHRSCLPSGPTLSPSGTDGGDD